MFGTIVNTAAIILGAILGLIFKGGIPERLRETIMNGLALCIIYIGISGTFKGTNTLLIIISLFLGALIGELLDIDKAITKLGDFIELKLNAKSSKISQGFVNSSLLFCVGAMAVVGSLQSGLSQNYKILYAKSILDGISAVIFASTFGIGVIFSAASVFIYQGLITVLAFALKSILVTTVIDNITAVGSLLILGLGFNMLKMTKIKIANLLPAILIPIIYELIIKLGC